MKKHILLNLCLFALIACGEHDSNENSNTEVSVINGGMTMVQNKDASEGAYWTEAKNLCETSLLGGYNDWRLPTTGELSAISGLYDDYYWSSEACGNSGHNAMYGGSKSILCKSNPCRVRCVRNNLSSSSSVLDNSSSSQLKTELTIHNQSSYEISMVKWNKAVFTDISRGDPETQEVQPGRGIVYFTLTTANTDTLEIKDAIVVKENENYTVEFENKTPARSKDGREMPLSALAEEISRIISTNQIIESLNLMLHKTDVSVAAKFDEARELCEISPESGFHDWRVPTGAELSSIFTNRNTIYGLNFGFYWSKNETEYCVQALSIGDKYCSKNIKPSTTGLLCSSGCKTYSYTYASGLELKELFTVCSGAYCSIDYIKDFPLNVRCVRDNTPQSSSSAEPSSSSVVPSSSSNTIVYGTLNDARDGKQYKTVVIGTQTWMAENLNYNATGSLCYNNSPSNCDKYGRLYNLFIALDVEVGAYENDKEYQGICPSGWHIPIRAEWQIFSDYVDETIGTIESELTLRTTTGWSAGLNGTDDFGFSALPGGWNYLSDGNSFHDGGLGGFWWFTDGAFLIGYDGIMDNFYLGDGWYLNALSVRCLKD
ncbi:MAG: hypothetical protein FWC26_11055 [Fibromonadales bacterium]|nr:hypothetical protein [Fibromonadales bacterium]